MAVSLSHQCFSPSLFHFLPLSLKSMGVSSSEKEINTLSADVAKSALFLP